MNRITNIFILLTLTLLLPTMSQAEKESSFWQLVAKSYLIVEGTIDVPAAEIQNAGQTGDHDYVEIKVAVTQSLKRKPESRNVIFRYYTDTEQYGGVSRNKVISFNGKSAIVFLQNIREKYYLAAYVSEAMQSSTLERVSRVQKEVESQEKMIQASDSYADNHEIGRAHV